MSLSQAEIKRLSLYKQKKYRERDSIFVVENLKILSIIADSEIEILKIYVNQNEASRILETNPWLNSKASIKTEVSQKDLERISGLSTPSNIFALCRRPCRELSAKDAFRGISVVLDGIQDPGNMGSIIRSCDWFGIDRIICSKSSANVFEPKVVQASMGAIASVPVFYEDLPKFLEKNAPKDFPVYGTFLEGENLFEIDFKEAQLKDFWLVIGNEGHGIGDDLQKYINRKINIPRFLPLESSRIIGSESLNASVSLAIVLSRLRG